MRVLNLKPPFSPRSSRVCFVVYIVKSKLIRLHATCYTCSHPFSSSSTLSLSNRLNEITLLLRFSFSSSVVTFEIERQENLFFFFSIDGDRSDHPVEDSRKKRNDRHTGGLSAGYASADTNAFTRLDLIK